MIEVKIWMLICWLISAGFIGAGTGVLISATIHKKCADEMPGYVRGKDGIYRRLGDPTPIDMEDCTMTSNRRKDAKEIYRQK